MEGERKYVYTRPTTEQDQMGNYCQSLTSLAFMQLVPGDDRAVRHICIRCIAFVKERVHNAVEIDILQAQMTSLQSTMCFVCLTFSFTCRPACLSSLSFCEVLTTRPVEKTSPQTKTKTKTKSECRQS